MIPDFPAFKDFSAEQAASTIKQQIEENKAFIEHRLSQGGPYTWDNFILPLERLEERLSRTFSVLSHLHSVKDSPTLREAYNQCLIPLSDYGTWLGQHHGLYAAYQALQTSSEWENFELAQKTVIEHALRDFKRSGIELEGSAKERYQSIQTELSRLSTQFEENLLDATEHWEYPVSDSALLAGLPSHTMAQAKSVAESQSHGGWILKLDFPTYQAVMRAADHRALREAFYRAHATRASALSDHPQWDNAPLIEKILALRHEKAQLLGYATFPDYVLAERMAKTPQKAIALLEELALHAKPFAQREIDEVKAFAKTQGLEAPFELWDLAYYSEKLSQHLFQIDQEALRPYFPLPVVLKGLFEIVKRLYGIVIRPFSCEDTWDPAVQVFSLETIKGKTLGYLYLDLYSRPGKREGAWMDESGHRFRTPEKRYLPVAFLTCNFTPPQPQQPALLTHDDVITLFHEWGHCLHHLLTKIDYPEVSGINGVPWDAVELPSQFFENWAWQREALPMISQHLETQACLPEEKIEALLRVKHFQVGLQRLRQIEFGLFDLAAHTLHNSDEAAFSHVQEKLNAIRASLSVFPPPDFVQFPQSFSHIFAGGYAAGYYSYQWAEVLSADLFSRFLEEGLFNPQAGAAFYQTFLASGGSRDPLELFKIFRGREPQIEALLKQEGFL